MIPVRNSALTCAFVCCLLTGTVALASQPAPSGIKATLELQVRDDWKSSYWIKVEWSPVAEKDVYYLVQTSLEDEPQSILEYGFTREDTSWTFTGWEHAVNYLVRVRACKSKDDCSAWTKMRLPIPATEEGMRLVAVNPAAPVISKWELEFRATNEELLGPYLNMDPAKLGRMWRKKLNITTCNDIKEVAKGPREAIEALTRMIATFDAQTNESIKKPQWIVPAELAKADVLAFNGREPDAIAFIKDRLRLRISPSSIGDRDDPYEEERITKLRKMMMTIQSSMHDSEAEQTARRLVDAEVKSSWTAFAERTRTIYSKSPDFVAQAASERDWAISQMRAETVGEFYLATGKDYEALALYESTASLREIDPNERNLKRSISEIRAKIAMAEGHSDEAEQYLRAYVKECNGCSAALFPLVRLLVSEGKSDATAGMFVRLKINVSEPISKFLPCTAGGRKREYSFSTGIKDDPAEPYPYNDVVEKGQTLEQGTELGTLLTDAGQIDDAVKVLKPTLKLQRTIFGISHPTSLATLAALAHAEQLRGENTQAAELWSEWLGASGEFLSNRLWNVSASSRKDFLRKDRIFVSEFLQSLLESTDEATAARQAFTISLSRKGLLARIAADSAALARASNEPGARPMVDELIKSRAELASATLLDESTPGKIDSAHKRLEKAEVALAKAIQTTRQPWTVPTIEQVQARLADGEALVDFQVFGNPQVQTSSSSAKEHVLAVVVTRNDGVRLFKWPDTTAAQTAINQYRHAMFDVSSNRGLMTLIADSKQPPSEQNTARLHALEQYSANMYAAIWQPLEPVLKGVRRVYLIPDGYLNSVPIRALKPQDGNYLIEQFDIVQFTSPRDLLLNAQANKTEHVSTNSLLVGAPEFGNLPLKTSFKMSSRGNRGASLHDVYFSPLPGSLEEARHISTILKPKYPVSLLTGNKATKSALLSVKSPPILHLATHGFYLDEPTRESENSDPVDALARSGLALANANSVNQGSLRIASDDGILTALEAISLDLSGTRLVTLSACETGVGLVEPGEGVHGLARSFREAGAQAVIATLWPIADEATSTFMQHFYRRIVNGEQPQSALQHTQVEFMHDPVLQDPLYWAPFILIGQ